MCIISRNILLIVYMFKRSLSFVILLFIASRYTSTWTGSHEPDELSTGSNPIRFQMGLTVSEPPHVPVPRRSNHRYSNHAIARSKSSSSWGVHQTVYVPIRIECCLDCGWQGPAGSDVRSSVRTRFNPNTSGKRDRFPVFSSSVFRDVLHRHREPI